MPPEDCDPANQCVALDCMHKIEEQLSRGTFAHVHFKVRLHQPFKDHINELCDKKGWHYHWQDCRPVMPGEQLQVWTYKPLMHIPLIISDNVPKDSWWLIDTEKMR